MFVLSLLARASFAAPTYVGSERCAACHQEIATAYRKTPMANASGILTQSPPSGGFQQKATGARFRIDGTRVLHSGTTHNLTYFIGSLAAGRSFLFQQDGFLFLAPVTYYTQAKRWDMSPGYQHARESLWNRPIEPNCLFCHSTRPQPIYATQNRYADPPFLEGGIGCERCHGPGSDHPQNQASIVNPAKLPPEERDSICAQCHLTGVARIDRPDMRLAMFRPGNKLSDFVSVFVYASAGSSRLRVTSHLEKLSHSACRRASGASLWCGSCHGIHKRTSINPKCLQCHQGKLETEHAARPNCTACHMPATKAADANHGVFTDHAIPRKPAAQTAASANGTLLPFSGFSSDDRALGLAYAEAALESNDAAHRREAIRLLRQAMPQHRNDWNLLTRLAFLESPEKALPLYQRSLALYPHQPVVLVNSGILLAQAGNIPQAIEYWRKALSMNPGLTEASRNLATALRATGQPREAEKILRDAAIFAPELLP